LKNTVVLPAFLLDTHISTWQLWILAFRKLCFLFFCLLCVR